MPFNASLPTWNKSATAPTTTKQTNGWAAQEHPPASIFNWFFNTTFLALQELQQEAINIDQKAIANGIATLDASGDLPIGQADNILNWVKGFGLGDVAKDISNTDLNALDATGFYRGGTLTNSPNGTGFFFILNFKHSTTFKGQIALTYSQGSTINQLYFRNMGSSGVWTSWVQLAQYDASGKVAIANLPDATTAAKGIAQLVDNYTTADAAKAATANALKSLADFVKGYGLGDVSKDISGTDLNALDVTGFYYGTSLTNSPEGTGAAAYGYQIVNAKVNATTKMQIATRINGGLQYFRTNSAGTWGAWKSIATLDATGKVAPSNLPSASTSAAGIVQLVDSITDTSTDKAATANSLKLLSNVAQMIKLTNDGGTRLNTSVADITTLGPGFYALGAQFTTPAMPVPNDTSYYMLDVMYTSSTKQFLLRRNFDNRVWFGSVHIDGLFKGWNEVVTDRLPTWNDATLQNGWVNWGGSDAPANYSKIGSVVRIRGTVKNGTSTASTVLFTLPAGYRPLYNQYFTTLCQGNGIVRIKVDINGSVTLNTAPSSNGWVQLDGITFVADGN